MLNINTLKSYGTTVKSLGISLEKKNQKEWMCFNITLRNGTTLGEVNRYNDRL